MRFFRADAAFAIPELYKDLEAAEYYYAVRLKKNAVLESRIAHRLTRPVGRPSKMKGMKSFHGVRDELFPRLGFIVTNLPMEPEEVVRCTTSGARLATHSRLLRRDCYVLQNRPLIDPLTDRLSFPKSSDQ